MGSLLTLARSVTSPFSERYTLQKSNMKRPRIQVNLRGLAKSISTQSPFYGSGPREPIDPGVRNACRIILPYRYIALDFTSHGSGARMAVSPLSMPLVVCVPDATFRLPRARPLEAAWGHASAHSGYILLLLLMHPICPEYVVGV